ncbi:hypothetical protein K461DRAFT_119440 [Myriangium duriaei CBS 260.36]|uniref:TAFII28-like protein domain-containing protein n=1 Tax=Myriangium duriaei CBS 260.36 TaxID=1168546 RepID=A0A9P4J5R3_9PEZI|nr:hypothetical protein K461DRAFT_119440 [Myriangium duriaei CBS 260.36]
MADATSPPLTSLSLPTKKRPPLSLPTSQPKRRKPSIASASSHPLRQTSFPPSDPPDGDAFSPGSLIDDDSDADLASAVTSTANGPTGSIADGPSSRGGRGRGRGRGRGSGRGRGRPRADTLSAVSGETGRRGGSSAPAAAAEDEGSGGEDEDEDVADLLDGGKIGRERLEEEKERRAMFLGALAGLSDDGSAALGTLLGEEEEERGRRKRVVEEMARVNAGRYELWNRIHLKKDVVRRLTNQTLSQSVPGTVVTAISAYTKVFAGEIVDRALRVQTEWTAARLEAERKEEVNGASEGEGQDIKVDAQHVRVDERDLGPLLPDHLREALRRYKADREGGVVGFTGMSLEGRENAAVRNGGRRLFR